MTRSIYLSTIGYYNSKINQFTEELDKLYGELISLNDSADMHCTGIETVIIKESKKLVRALIVETERNLNKAIKLRNELSKKGDKRHVLVKN